MHEYSLVKKEVERIKAAANGKKVTRVIFHLGRLAHGNPESIRQAYSVATAESDLSGAEVEVVSIDPKIKCGDCGTVFGVEKKDAFSCPSCGSYAGELIAGDECYIEHIEAEK